MNASIEAVEIARLKRAFGAALTAAEESLLASAPPSRGPDADWLRDCLARWQPAPDPEDERRAAGPPDLIARFEQTRREQARRFLRGFPRFLAFVLGIATVPVPVLVYLKTGGLPVGVTLQVLAFMWLMLGGFSAACWQRARRTLRESDLVRFSSMRESGSHRSPASRGLLWGSLLVLVALQARTEGWLTAGGRVLGLLVVFGVAERLLRRAERRRRLAEDRELWAWWYGEAGDPTARR